MISFIDRTLDRDLLIRQPHEPHNRAGKNFTVLQRRCYAASESIRSNQENLDFVSFPVPQEFQKHAKAHSGDGHKNKQSQGANSDHES